MWDGTNLHLLVSSGLIKLDQLQVLTAYDPSAFHFIKPCMLYMFLPLLSTACAHACCLFILHLHHPDCCSDLKVFEEF
jgi:hypothetical protein